MPRRRRVRVVVLPPQQNINGTYIGRARGIRAHLRLLTKDSHEDKVAAVMAGILSVVFPTTQGYMPGPESQVKLRNKTGRIDMRYTYTRQNVQTGQDEIFDPICIEYKSPKWEESPY